MSTRTVQYAYYISFVLFYNVQYHTTSSSRETRPGGHCRQYNSSYQKNKAIGTIFCLDRNPAQFLFRLASSRVSHKYYNSSYAYVLKVWRWTSRNLANTLQYSRLPFITQTIIGYFPTPFVDPPLLLVWRLYNASSMNVSGIATSGFNILHTGFLHYVLDMSASA